jgi:hypothetical protein
MLDWITYSRDDSVGESEFFASFQVLILQVFCRVVRIAIRALCE